jgi:hypothetical protein
VLRPSTGVARDALDLKDAIVLVSCVKSKLPHSAPARELYTSTWFSKVRDLVEANGARWFVLSSLYGLVDPNHEIAPYDHTLNPLGVAERREWAAKVLRQLLPEVKGYRRIVMFAGQRYREFLVQPLRQQGIDVIVPMENLSRGQQLAWLAATPPSLPAGISQNISENKRGATGGKYNALHTYLLGLDKTEWRARFAEIEKILGFALPSSARNYAAWWANTADGSHPHSAAWTAAGWRTSNLNLTGETVWFTRYRAGESRRPPSPNGPRGQLDSSASQQHDVISRARAPEDQPQVKPAADQETTSNFLRVTEGFEILTRGLSRFVGRELKAKYGADWWNDAVLAVLREHQKHGLPLAGDDNELIHSLDVVRSLILVDQHWSYLFRSKLSRESRSWVKELIQVRNQWAHKGLRDMTDEDAWRALDTMIRIAAQIGGKPPERLRELARAVRFGI